MITRTFTIDREGERRLLGFASLTGKPISVVIRDAITWYFESVHTHFQLADNAAYGEGMKRISVKMEKDMIEKLDKYALENKVPKSLVIRKILHAYLDEKSNSSVQQFRVEITKMPRTRHS